MRNPNTLVSSEYSPEHQNRLQAAVTLISDHQTMVTERFGSDMHHGNEGWLPCHAHEVSIFITTTIAIYENTLQLKQDLAHSTDQTLEQLKHYLSSLSHEDLPTLLLMAALHYGDYSDLNILHIDYIKEKMAATGVFHERDYRMVDAVLPAALVKKDEQGYMSQRVEYDSPFVGQQLVLCDGIFAFHARADSIYNQLLLCLERLLKADSIAVSSAGQPSRPPRTLQEVSLSTYDETVFLASLEERRRAVFLQPRQFYLPITPVLYPYHERNCQQVQQLCTEYQPGQLPQMLAWAKSFSKLLPAA